MNKITSYKCYPDNVVIFTDDGSCAIALNHGCDFGGATWTEEEADNDAREMLREHGIDDATADDWLISTIAAAFPREGSVNA